jgi:NADH:ubiquinone oxidoreductase subunit E
MSAVHDIHITICMGSSCFARGNNRNIEVLKELAINSPPGVRCCLSGRLCEGQCTLGPNLVIEGKMHHGIDPVGVMSLVGPQFSALGQADSPSGSNR